MMAIQTAYQAYNELHKDDEGHDHHEHGIIHDFKESMKEVIHQIKGKDHSGEGSFEDSTDKDILVENELIPDTPTTAGIGDDNEKPQFSKTGYINPIMNTFTPKDANQPMDFDFSQSRRRFSSSSKQRPRKESKTDRQIISGAGDDILQIVPHNKDYFNTLGNRGRINSNSSSTFDPFNNSINSFNDSGNGTLVDSGKHVEVICEAHESNI
jgi:hypothetical protein